MMDGNDNNQPATGIVPESEFRLRYLIECEKLKEETIRANKKIEEEQKTERERIAEEQATKRHEEVEKTRRKRIAEEQETERTKIKHTQSLISNILPLSSHYDFYIHKVQGNLYDFEIDWISPNDNDYFNGEIKTCIGNYLEKIPSSRILSEAKLQKHVNDLIADLLNALGDSTVLKCQDTPSSKYLATKFCPDCTFIFKNINAEKDCLEDFVVCLGELKRSNKDMTEKNVVGQLLQYLSLLLTIQARQKIYGFLLNTEYIQFYYVERRPNSSDYNYFKSKSLPIYDHSSKDLPSNDKQKITTDQTSEENIQFCEKTWKIFTKFLIMQTDFYRYETLNIDPKDNELNKYEIQKRLGFGLTSKVYFLNNRKKNMRTTRQNTIQQDNSNTIESGVIKISKDDGYSSEFFNELEITKKLKVKDIDKFKLFFQEIAYSSPKGNYLIFKNELEKLESFSLSQSEEIFDIIEYLYDSNIIHRDIRPNNLMFDRSSQHVKLIDFGFAITLDINDESKEVPIAGTITYAGYEFLNFYSKIEHNAVWSRSYRYDKKFDSKCALNIIIYMFNRSVRHKLNEIEELPSTEQKTPKLLELWANVKKEHEKYSNLLTTINNLTESSEFQKLKGQLKELYEEEIAFM
ncbi:unnamed protein product [Rotaria socialis]|uniref:Protein kinase domain-containing protein n=2 Tax=Rotaria socialis TaxID=392032 RepID=A0A820WZB0_9BILA|nr:unnamed protein product [Rotaria socialis]CAF3520061.1 unnamed protein product [Rotaria socialis]CAF4222238.1 unnamed protein product [Rotaria socialis]CAF4524209.1 unnamed protein product [Rotaria socialis]